ncbi:SIR2 family NAD-dependent protein deacylase [Polymorphum gilvum]|uniref:protein acetyllysine N-acetyltransferase n=1 Tax=Polymorphum gilvum (strain LMG 25793 / CGMCC 1.9160 / SL003B-26A1) TaxID=991905 RepID=F2IX91_POLGS|nr:Sir2 family NAD-dependent protein deacetylase [Polymorphum gilvum]ADZ70409.1 NAD-dependent deacetylase 1 [Polymorphum gilvum SL003B-26A1]
MEIETLDEARTELAALFGPDAGRVVVLTGAGISTESGIPDFRSPGGIWSRMRPIQYRDFVASEADRLEDWRRRFVMLADFERAEPNCAHLALARLACAGLIDTVVTQNIDGLHGRAGLPADRLIELHGNATHARCLDCGAPAELREQEAEAAAGRSPRCRVCDGLLKAAVVSFGQAMPEDETARAFAAAAAADLFVVIGSSLVVHPAADLPLAAARAGAELAIVNRDPTPLDRLASVVIRTPIAETFRALAQAGGT